MRVYREKKEKLVFSTLDKRTCNNIHSTTFSFIPEEYFFIQVSIRLQETNQRTKQIHSHFVGAYNIFLEILKSIL